MFLGIRGLVHGRETQHRGPAALPAENRASAVSSPAQDVELTRQEAAEFMALMLDSLKLLAQDAQLTFLAYLIGMALEEAPGRKVPPPRLIP
jgi:hypothetical protein